ncbi:HLA class II histocompatibility antigen, DM alpha chain [Lissotriton helveticus]
MARVTGAQGCSGLALLLLLALPHTGDSQVFSYMLSCQPGTPRTLLSATYNDDEMFHYNFQTQRTEARLPDFQKWEQYPFDLSTVPHEAELCQSILAYLDRSLGDIMPQATGTPVLDVFTRHPLEFGKPNTLICFISNFFPPVLNVTWKRREVPVTSGVWTTDYSPTGDGGFYAFSYLNITPTPDDVYSCSVTQANAQYSSIKNWLPKNPVPSYLLENALCGLALSLGVVGIAVGIILLVKGRKPRQTE